MKKTNSLTLSAILCIGLFHFAVQCQAQMQKWYMNYYQIDFSGSTPQFSSLPFSFTSSPNSVPNRFANVANGAYDAQGNLLFYSVWDDTNPTVTGYIHKVYNGNGNLVGTLPVHPSGQGITIVPFTNDADKYLIIFSGYGAAGATRFLHYVINANNGLKKQR